MLVSILCILCCVWGLKILKIFQGGNLQNKSLFKPIVACFCGCAMNVWHVYIEHRVIFFSFSTLRWVLPKPCEQSSVTSKPRGSGREMLDRLVGGSSSLLTVSIPSETKCNTSWVPHTHLAYFTFASAPYVGEVWTSNKQYMYIFLQNRVVCQCVQRSVEPKGLRMECTIGK